jgi:hypothetical protein
MQKAFLNEFNNVLGSVREPLLVLDTSLKVVGANLFILQKFLRHPGKYGRCIDL